MATWGHSICPFPTLGTGATGMIHVFRGSHELTGFNPYRLEHGGGGG